MTDRAKLAKQLQEVAVLLEGCSTWPQLKHVKDSLLKAADIVTKSAAALSAGEGGAQSHLPDYKDSRRPPLPWPTINYWFQCARDAQYPDHERWLYMENVVNHMEGALLDAERMLLLASNPQPRKDGEAHSDEAFGSIPRSARLSEELGLAPVPAAPSEDGLREIASNWLRSIGISEGDKVFPDQYGRFAINGILNRGVVPAHAPVDVGKLLLESLVSALRRLSPSADLLKAAKAEECNRAIELLKRVKRFYARKIDDRTLAECITSMVPEIDAAIRSAEGGEG